MPISVKQQIKPYYKLGKEFSLKDIPNFSRGSILQRVKEDLSEEGFEEFRQSWDVNVDIDKTQRNITRALARKFNLTQAEEGIFNDLFMITVEARKYLKKNKKDLEEELTQSYDIIAGIAKGTSANGKKSFERIVDREDERFVIFSDHHITNFSRKPNFFKDSNYALYVSVLDHYLRRDYCLVENGDVEECIIYEPTADDAQERYEMATKKIKFPIKPNQDWKDFLDRRYRQREVTLIHLINSFPTYYAKLRQFSTNGKLIRLSGNHDTYMQGIAYERPLLNKIEETIESPIHDVLRVRRNEDIKYLVFHGHQVDINSILYGDEYYAWSFGEVFSECTSWAFEGPDRAWREKESNEWIYGGDYRNILARETPRDYDLAELALLVNMKKDIQNNPKGFMETLLGHEIAWEYFNNDDAFDALTLEIWQGDEMYKIRHTNEKKLYNGIVNAYTDNTYSLSSMPKFVLGHTHEPRQNPHDYSSRDTFPKYINSGSAGRYHNLIWCVEIIGNTEYICSWSRVNHRLKKIRWRNTGALLVHDSVEWY